MRKSAMKMKKRSKKKKSRWGKKMNVQGVMVNAIPVGGGIVAIDPDDMDRFLERRPKAVPIIRVGSPWL